MLPSFGGYLNAKNKEEIDTLFQKILMLRQSYLIRALWTKYEICREKQRTVMSFVLGYSQQKEMAKFYKNILGQTKVFLENPLRFLFSVSRLLLRGFSLLGRIGGSPSTSRKFAHPLRPGKSPQVDSPIKFYSLTKR